MNKLIVLTAAAISVLLTVPALVWLRLLKNPFVGVAPDVVTPLFIAPLSLLIAAAWTTALLRAYSAPVRPRPDGRLLIAAAAVAFMAGTVVFGLPVWQAAVPRIAAGVQTQIQQRNATVFYGGVGGLALMNLITVPFWAMLLARRPPPSN